MEAVPFALKQAIGVGIGLFIALIGFFTAGFVVKPSAGPLPVLYFALPFIESLFR